MQTQTTGILNDFPTPPAATHDGEEPGLTLPEFIYSTYNSLLESGWRMDEIDRMDMPGFFRVRAWKASRGGETKRAPPTLYRRGLEEYAARGVTLQVFEHAHNGVGGCP